MEASGAQAYTFFTMALAGVLIAAGVDLWLAARRAFRLGSIASAVGDLLVAVFAGTLSFAALFYGNWGELRGYAFLGLAAGAGAYRLILSDLGYRSALRCFRGVRRGLSSAGRGIGKGLSRGYRAVRGGLARGWRTPPE